MDENKSFTKVNVSIGYWIYNLSLLQVLTILYILKGFILFGLFPAIASVFNIMYKWIVKDEYDLSISKTYKQFYNENFVETNKIGWGMLLVGLVLVFDLFIDSRYLQSVFVHTFLLVLFFIYLAIFMYVFPVFARYQLKTFQYIKQSFFIGLTSIAQTIAILLAVVIVGQVMTYIPFILLFFGIPFFIGPVAWFAIQGIEKAESMKEQLE